MSDRRRIYLDTCCFIDMVKMEVGIHLEDDRKKDVWYGKQLLQAAKNSELDLFTSVITIAECQHVDGSIAPDIKSNFNRLLMSGQYVKLIQPTPFIALDAQNLRWTHGVSLRGADSLHVASALDRKCEEFLTTDERLSRVENKRKLGTLGLNVCSPSGTNCLPSKYLQLAFPQDDKKDKRVSH